MSAIPDIEYHRLLRKAETLCCSCKHYGMFNGCNSPHAGLAEGIHETRSANGACGPDGKLWEPQPPLISEAALNRFFLVGQTAIATVATIWLLTLLGSGR